MAFPADPLDVTAQLLLGGEWTDITTDVFGGDRDQIVITRGRQSEGSRSDPTRCDLSIRNTSGVYSPRNPASAHYGLLGRNTPMRVFTGTEHVGAAGGSSTASTSHVAPTVTAAGSGLLICGWISDDPLNYTLPGGMTAGPAETDGTYSTMRTAYQSVSAGATGTRTATASASHGYASVSAVVHGTAVTVQETLSGTNETLTDITLTTSASTQAGWWMVAVQCWVRGSDVPMPDAPYGDDGGWILLADSDVIEGLFAGTFTTYLHARVWARRVNTTGAQTVIFAGESTTGAADNQAALYVLSGVDDWNLRASVEVPAWPPRWDVTGNDVWVPISASGIMRRLGQGASPLLSPLRRALTGAGATVQVGRNLLPAAYWPLEDGTDSTRAASGLTDGTALLATGEVRWASSTAPGSAPLPDWSAATGAVEGPVTSGFDGSDWSVGCMVQLTGATSWTALVVGIDAGFYQAVRLVLSSSSTAVEGVTSSSTSTILSAAEVADGLPHWVEIRMVDGGGGFVNTTLHVDGSQVATTSAVGVQGRPAQVRVQSRSADSATLGHVALWSEPVSSTYALILDQALIGHLGEPAGRRVERLCHEEGIAVHIVGDPDDTVTMGAQPVASLLDLLRECEDADGGILYEPREALGLAYRTVRSRYNQPVTLALTYGAAGEVSPPLEPADDDRNTRNDVTASRRDGSSARVEITSGPLSTQPPPDGVGRYDHQVTVNVHGEHALADQAGWRAHLGTWDEPRFPTIRVNLAALAGAGKSALAETAAALDVGDRLTVASPPVWLPPGSVDQHAEGYVETLNQFVWDLRLACVPAGPYTVAEVDGEPRVAADGSTLAAAISSSATTLTLASTAENGPWTTTSGDFPLSMRVGAEQVTATSIAHGLSDTFTRTTSSGWGTATSGQAWTTSGGSASDYSTSGTRGVHAVSTVSVTRESRVALGVADVDITLTHTGVNVAAAGGNIEQGLVARYVDASNLVDLRIFRAPAATPTVAVRQLLAGVETFDGFPSITGATSTSAISLRLQAIGSVVRGKAWITGQPEPDWMVEITATHLTAGDVAIRSVRAAANTNTTLTCDYDDLVMANPQTVTLSARSVNGVVRAWDAGTEVDVWTPAVAAL